MPDRMFSVLVLSGIALAGVRCGGVIGGADGGATDAAPKDGPAGDTGRADSRTADALPPVDAVEEFPSELPASVDAGHPDVSVDAGSDGFPVLGK